QDAPAHIQDEVGAVEVIRGRVEPRLYRRVPLRQREQRGGVHTDRRRPLRFRLGRRPEQRVIGILMGVRRHAAPARSLPTEASHCCRDLIGQTQPCTSPPMSAGLPAPSESPSFTSCTRVFSGTGMVQSLHQLPKPSVAFIAGIGYQPGTPVLLNTRPGNQVPEPPEVGMTFGPM